MKLIDELKKWPYSPRETLNIWLFLLPKMLNVVSKILMWIMALLILFGAISGLRTHLFVSKAVSTKAKIIANMPSSTSIADIPIYSFQAKNGKFYKITSSTGYGPPLGRPGDLIDILYDPDDPEIAEENNFRALWAVSYYSLRAGLMNFLLFGALYLYTKRKLKKRIKDTTSE